MDVVHGSWCHVHMTGIEGDIGWTCDMDMKLMASQKRTSPFLLETIIWKQQV